MLPDSAVAFGLSALYDGGIPSPICRKRQPMPMPMKPLPPKNLPDFKTLPQEQVESLLRRVLSHDSKGEVTHLREVHAYEDGHYRAVFNPAYFTLSPGQTEPTKSQWNGLKKKLKRHDPRVFIFKDHGMVPYGAERFCFLDIGFFAS